MRGAGVEGFLPFMGAACTIGEAAGSPSKVFGGEVMVWCRDQGKATLASTAEPQTLTFWVVL